MIHYETKESLATLVSPFSVVEEILRHDLFAANDLYEDLPLIDSIIEEVMGTHDNPMCTLPLADRSVTFVDAEDYPHLSKYTWRKHDNGRGKIYVSRTEGKEKIYLHREIMRASKGQIVDHKNGDPLDNRKANLRFTTAGGNARNRAKAKHHKHLPTTSSYKGVCWDRGRRKYRAGIGKNGEQFFLGYFSESRDAALAYDEKAIELFGEFAWTNFGPGGVDERIDIQKVIRRLVERTLSCPTVPEAGYPSTYERTCFP